MKQVAIGIAALVAGTSMAGAASASVGPLSCWSAAASSIEMQGCVTQQAENGGTFGRCTIVTTVGSKTFTTQLVGVMKPWGGVHPIRKARRSLEVKYEPGKFACRFVPSPDYVVGDCVTGPASGSCTVIKSINGSNAYFKASATARPD
jgi:hypothetical protein